MSGRNGAGACGRRRWGHSLLSLRRIVGGAYRRSRPPQAGGIHSFFLIIPDNPLSWGSADLLSGGRETNTPTKNNTGHASGAGASVVLNLVQEKGATQRQAFLQPGLLQRQALLQPEFQQPELQRALEGLQQQLRPQLLRLPLWQRLF